MNLYVMVWPGRPRARSTAAASMIMAAGLLVVLAVAGCSAGASNSPSAAALPAAPGAHAGVAGAAGSAPAGSAQAGSAQAGRTADPSLAAAAGQAIVYTASLTVRAADVSRAATLATRIATAAGGYLSSENTLLDRARPAQSTVDLQLKIPVVAYQATLAALSSRLGTRISVSQQAQDVTRTVADVKSRVTSAQAAITQLRALLARAGSIGDLLTVQTQIDSQESDLESLQSQQRALSAEASDATVTLVLVSKPGAAVKGNRKLAGLPGGLEAGWHGLRAAVSLLLTGIGAALPFAAFAALAGYCAYLGRRWLLRRRLPRPGAG